MIYNVPGFAEVRILPFFSDDVTVRSYVIFLKISFSIPLGLNPIQARLFLPFKGPGGSLGTPLLSQELLKVAK